MYMSRERERVVKTAVTLLLKIHFQLFTVVGVMLKVES